MDIIARNQSIPSVLCLLIEEATGHNGLGMTLLVLGAFEPGSAGLMQLDRCSSVLD